MDSLNVARRAWIGLYIRENEGKVYISRKRLINTNEQHTLVD